MDSMSNLVSKKIFDLLLQETLYNVWIATLNLWDDVTKKKINLQQLKLELKLYSVLNNQVMPLSITTLSMHSKLYFPSYIFDVRNAFIFLVWHYNNSVCASLIVQVLVETQGGIQCILIHLLNIWRSKFLYFRERRIQTWVHLEKRWMPLSYVLVHCIGLNLIVIQCLLCIDIAFGSII